MTYTVHDVLSAISKYDGAPDAHSMVIADNGVELVEVEEE